MYTMTVMNLYTKFGGNIFIQSEDIDIIMDARSA